MTAAAQPVKLIAEAAGRPPVVSPRLNASLALQFAYDAAAQRTVLAFSSQDPPLRVIRAFANRDSSALVHLHNVSGGLLGGDHLKLQVDVGANASAQITTTGATRIYRPRATAHDLGAPAAGHAAAPPDVRRASPAAGHDVAPATGKDAVFRKGTASAVPLGSSGWEALAPGESGVGESSTHATALRKGTASAVTLGSPGWEALAPGESGVGESSTHATALRKGTASAVPSDSSNPGALAPEETGASCASVDEIGCIQTNAIHVGQDALLEYVPDAIIPFAGSRFAQRTTIHLEDGAGLFWWEILAPGREARGEIFEYERVQMQANISSRGRRIASENARIEPRLRALSSLARLGPYRYWATFYICRAGLDPRVWLAEEQHLRDAASPLNRPGEVLWGISTLVADGLVVRALALRGRDLLSGLHHLWNAAKLRLYGREAIPPRKLP